MFAVVSLGSCRDLYEFAIASGHYAFVSFFLLLSFLSIFNGDIFSYTSGDYTLWDDRIATGWV